VSPVRRNQVRILLSEGSSTNAREIITALGLSGYPVDVCDPSGWCLGRFSRFVRRVHRCPVSGTDPVGYLRFIVALLERERYDVLLPANEQAYLFSWARHRLEPLTGLAVADVASFDRVQTKATFTRLLDELGLAQPPTRCASTWADVERAVEELGMPCFVKLSASTASTGVWRVDDAADLDRLHRQLTSTEHEPDRVVVVQAAALGAFEQSHAVFDRGRLVALACTRRIREGAQGGAAVKRAVTRPAVAADYRVLGEALAWHGSFSADYFWNPATGTAAYIDANPRLTEPMNAYYDGLDLPDLQVQLSLGRHPAPLEHTGNSTISHSTVQAVLGTATRDGSRRAVLAELRDAVSHRGAYAGSREGMTPVLRDPPSAVALTVVVAGLMLAPRTADAFTHHTIQRYALGDAVRTIAGSPPPEFGLGERSASGRVQAPGNADGPRTVSTRGRAIAVVTQRLGSTRIGVAAIGHLVSPLQRAVHRGTRGRASLTGRAPVLLLITTGRRTGRPRTVPVFYLRDGDDFVVCNVTPPHERPNPWTLNLRATREAQVEIGPTSAAVHARPATEREIAAYWPRLVDLWPAFDDFYRRGGRRSVFVLSPAPAPAHQSPS
jgi:deazaflavin-dependent oxidoreductase (nitroreductase family)